MNIDLNTMLQSINYACGLYFMLLLEKNIIYICATKIRIYKQSKYDGEIIREAPFINTCKIEKLKKEIDEQKIELLLPFMEKLEKYTTKENLITSYKNLKTAKIEKDSFISSFFNPSEGIYYSDENKITYNKLSAIGHEFLHMCSTYYDTEKEENYSGFKQGSHDYIIGTALNEGYTELLASRIYNKNNKVTAYSRAVKIARLFELFFENPKDMEKYYFNHDLLGFIHYMERFAPRKDITDILLKLDNTLFIENNDLLFPITYQYVDIQLKLYEWYSSNIYDKSRLQKFKDIICESKINSLLFNSKSMKLIKDNPYSNEMLLANSKIDKAK